MGGAQGRPQGMAIGAEKSFVNHVILCRHAAAAVPLLNRLPTGSLPLGHTRNRVIVPKVAFTPIVNTLRAIGEPQFTRKGR